MQRTSLGFTEAQVSSLCLGTMFYGTKVSQDSAIDLLDQYFENGGNFIDTANIYAWWVPGFVGGESETLVGKWINERKIRKDIFLASKVGFDYGSVKRELKSKTIIVECEKSLRRLGVETIDLYYAHVDDRTTPFEEILESFTQLINSGKVRFIGASNIRAWRLEQAHCISKSQSFAEYCCVQQRYTYLQPRAGTKFETQVAVNDDLVDYCNSRNVTLLAYSPLLKGAYVRANRPFYPQYQSEDNQMRLTVLKSIADECGVTINQVVLAWLLHQKSPILPVFSASTQEQLAENLDALKIKFSDEQFSRLQNVVNS
jgi:aryl-alcohol dehydrogenase-like predicted oxidoreductase